jgi:hypothetical protein
MPDVNLERKEDAHSDAGSPLRVYGSDLPTLATPQTLENIATAWKYYY